MLPIHAQRKENLSLALPHFTGDQPLTAAGLNTLIRASGTGAAMPLFVPGENPAVKLNMLRDAAGLAALVPPFDILSTAPFLAQLNQLVDAINALPGLAAGGRGDGSAIVAGGDTELLDGTFQQIPAGQQMLTVQNRRGRLQDFLAASFGGVHIRGLGPGVAFDPATGVISFTGGSPGDVLTALLGLTPAQLATLQALLGTTAPVSGGVPLLGPDGASLLSPIDSAPLLAPVAP